MERKEKKKAKVKDQRRKRARWSRIVYLGITLENKS